MSVKPVHKCHHRIPAGIKKKKAEKERERRKKKERSQVKPNVEQTAFDPTIKRRILRETSLQGGNHTHGKTGLMLTTSVNLVEPARAFFSNPLPLLIGIAHARPCTHTNSRRVQREHSFIH